MAKKFVCSDKLVVTRVDVQERKSTRTGTDYDQVVVSFEGNLRVRCFASDEINYNLLSRLQSGEKLAVSFNSVSVFIPGQTAESTQSGGTAEQPRQAVQNPTPQVNLEDWHIDWDSHEAIELSDKQKEIMARSAHEKRKVESRVNTSLLRAVNDAAVGSDDDIAVDDDFN